MSFFSSLIVTVFAIKRNQFELSCVLICWTFLVIYWRCISNLNNDSSVVVCRGFWVVVLVSTGLKWYLAITFIVIRCWWFWIKESNLCVAVCLLVTAANSKVHNCSIQLLLNFFDSCADSGQPTKPLYFPYQELYWIDLTYIYSTVHVYYYVKTKIETEWIP